jgi:hypothetical protein
MEYIIVTYPQAHTPKRRRPVITDTTTVNPMVIAFARA